LLSAEDISVTYNGESQLNELDSVTLQIVPGVVTAIIGPNGSGKSTLIRAISRVLEPTAGVILLNGQDLYNKVTARQSAQSISVTPQDTHVAFDFTARELVAMGRAPQREGWTVFSGESAEDSAIIDGALVSQQISPEIASRPVTTLSGGERQRALIARAFAQNAPILLMDEPTSALDLAHQVTLFEQLKSLAVNENKAVVIVLHDLSLAAAHANRLVVLSEGKIVADGSVEEVLTREMIRDVYHCEVNISSDPASGSLVVSPKISQFPSEQLEGVPIYVISGGGGASNVLRVLEGAGAKLFAGYLHKGDIDRQTAEVLNIPSFSVPPFQFIPEMSQKDIDTIVKSYRLVVFSPGDVSMVNFESLSTALALAKSGVPVYSLGHVSKKMDSKNPPEEPIFQAWAELRSLPVFHQCVDELSLVRTISGAINAGTS